MPTYYVDGTITSASGTGSGTELDPWGKTDDLIHYAVTQIEAGAGKGSRGDKIIILAGDVNSTQSPWIQQTTATNYYNQDRPLGIVGNGRDRTNWDAGGNPKIGYDYNEGQTRLDNIVFADMTLSNLPTASGTANHLWGGSTYACFWNCDILFDPAQNGVMTNTNRSFQLINCRYTPSQAMQAYSGGASSIGTYYDCRNSPASNLFYSGSFFDCFFDLKDAGRTAASTGFLQVAPRVINCTFDVRGNTGITCGRLDGWETSFWYNNYVHGDVGATQQFLVTLYGQGACLGLFGNVGFGISAIAGGNNLPPANPNTTFCYEDDTIISESGVKNAGNGDFRPSDALMGAAKFERGIRDDYINQRRTAGCFTAQNLIGKPYHPRVRG